MILTESKAHKRYLIGEIITISDPIVHVINEEFKGKCCDCCLAATGSTHPLKKCTKCKHMFYCGRRCQKNDWRVHKLECKYYKKFGQQFFNDRFDRLLIRLWLISKFNQTVFTKNYRLPNGSELTFNKIQSYCKDIGLDDKRVFESICIRFKSFGIEFDPQMLYHLFCKVLRYGIDCETPAINKRTDQLAVNNIELKIEPDLPDIKFWAVYVPITVFGHSCVPNACKVFKGNKIQLRAIKPIFVNEEITISYVFLEKSKIERQKELRNRFFTECHCLKCGTNFDNFIDYKRLKILENLRMNAMNELYLKPIKNYANHKDLDDIEEELMAIYRNIYGDYYPNLTVEYTQYFNWKFLSQSETEQNLNLLKRYILKIILITHGFNHPFFENFVKLIKVQDLIEKKS